MLGLILQQPRFNKKKNTETIWYSEHVKEVKRKIKQLRRKFRRIRPMWMQMDHTTQRILASTYVLSRLRYASAIYYPLIAPSSKKEIESAIRGMVRDVFNTSQSANTRYFELFTSHIPLGLKALQSKMNLIGKLQKYYPQEIDEYNERMGVDWFQKQIKKYCPSLEEEEIDINDAEQW